MKYLFLVASTFLFISCSRQTINVYSPHAVNTTIVKNDGDAGANVSYFGNAPRHVGERNLNSNGIALQTRIVITNRWFVENSISRLSENSDGEFYNLASDLFQFKSNTKYNNWEIGIGKILKMNTSGSSNFLISTGYGRTKFSTKQDIIETNITKLADFNFNNNHLYLNVIAQISSGNFTYQVGLKHSQTNFTDIGTSTTFFKEEVNTLKNNINGYTGSTQFFNDFGIYPIKDNNWFSIHAGFSFTNRLNLDPNFRTRTFGANLSVMANASNFWKRKK